MGELAAVAVLHGEQYPAGGIVGLELDLGDARQVLADLVAIGVRWSAEGVEVDLLVEIHVRGRPFLAARIARVDRSPCRRRPTRGRRRPCRH